MLLLGTDILLPERNNCCIDEVAGLETNNITLVINHNLNSAQALLGVNYLGLETWEALGLTEQEIAAIYLPILTDVMLKEIERLLALGFQPILWLDIGKSIEEVERMAAKKQRPLFKEDEDAERLRLESFYKEKGRDCPRWIIVPGSDHGVLQESRNKGYNELAEYMRKSYPGYELGGVRELLNLAMLKYQKDGTVLFTRDPFTFGRCTDQYKGGDFPGLHIELGCGELSSSKSFGGLLFVPSPLNLGNMVLVGFPALYIIEAFELKLQEY